MFDFFVCKDKEIEELPSWITPIKRLIFSGKVGNWCQLPYPNHPKGCPNYGKKKDCPPRAKKIWEVFDLKKSLYLINSEFDLRSFGLEMKKKHPDWTRKKCRCVLYWQPKSRKQLKDRISWTLTNLNLDVAFTIPEAMGLNVYATARINGLHLERIRNLQICKHVALAGFHL